MMKDLFNWILFCCAIGFNKIRSEKMDTGSLLIGFSLLVYNKTLVIIKKIWQNKGIGWMTACSLLFLRSSVRRIFLSLFVQLFRQQNKHKYNDNNDDSWCWWWKTRNQRKNKNPSGMREKSCPAFFLLFSWITRSRRYNYVDDGDDEMRENMCRRSFSVRYRYSNELSYFLGDTQE